MTYSGFAGYAATLEPQPRVGRGQAGPWALGVITGLAALAVFAASAVHGAPTGPEPAPERAPEPAGEAPAPAHPAAQRRGLRLAWKDNLLRVISPELPGGELQTWYLEAYCRPGSTDRDWAQTVIGHRTRLVEEQPDGSALKLECTLRDGVVVTHHITAGEDEVSFQLVATNPTSQPSQAHWAQPCTRVGAFTGHNDPQRKFDYIARCFVFIDGKLSRLPTPDWATEARYTPGQVWRAPGVPTQDVNPRPLNPRTPSLGLIGCESADGKMLFATAWEPYQELFQGVITCIHSDFRIGGLNPGESKRIRGRMYLVPNDLQALLRRYRADFPEHHKPGNQPTPAAEPGAKTGARLGHALTPALVAAALAVPGDSRGDSRAEARPFDASKLRKRFDAAEELAKGQSAGGLPSAARAELIWVGLEAGEEMMRHGAFADAAELFPRLLPHVKAQDWPLEDLLAGKTEVAQQGARLKYRLRGLHNRLKASPKDRDLRRQLAEAYLIEADLPARAAPYLSSATPEEQSDARLVEWVIRNPVSWTARESLELGDAYLKLAQRAQGVARRAMLDRSLECLGKALADPALGAQARAVRRIALDRLEQAGGALVQGIPAEMSDEPISYDLLAGTDASTQGRSGWWTHTGEALEAKGEGLCWFNAAPALWGSQAVEITVERPLSKAPFTLAIPVGERHAFLRLGDLATAGGGLMLKPDDRGNRPETKLGTSTLRPDSAHTLLALSVFRGEHVAINLFLDGQKLVEWAGPADLLETPRGWERLAEPGKAAVVVEGGPLRVSRWRLRLLAGEVIRTPGSAPVVKVAIDNPKPTATEPGVTPPSVAPAPSPSMKPPRTGEMVAGRRNIFDFGDE